jgi:hypothetical protein
MNNSISINTQELSKKEKRAAYNKAYYKANKQRLAAQHQAYREEHKDKVKEYHKKYSKVYYEANKEKAVDQNQAWAKRNREKTRAYHKAWREVNRDKVNKEKRKLYDKTYREANREKLRDYVKNWRKNNPGRSYSSRKQRHEKNPLSKAADLLRSVVYKSFSRIGKNKPADTRTLLGCDWKEAKAHIESLFKEGMSWDNYGEWHIDHIVPVDYFVKVLKNLDSMNLISNLQPLWADENREKGNKTL